MNLSEWSWYSKWDDEPISRCVACGDVIDYCQGHGMIGDPSGYAILVDHDDDHHTFCHPAGCPFTSERPTGGTP